MVQSRISEVSFSSASIVVLFGHPCLFILVRLSRINIVRLKTSFSVNACYVPHENDIQFSKIATGMLLSLTTLIAKMKSNADTIKIVLLN